MDIPASYHVAYSRRSLHPHTSVDRQIANGRVFIRGEVELWCLHDDEHEQGYNSGQVTPDRVEVAAAFERVLVKVIGLLLCCELLVCARTVHARQSAFSVVRLRQIIE